MGLAHRPAAPSVAPTGDRRTSMCGLRQTHEVRRPSRRGGAHFVQGAIRGLRAKRGSCRKGARQRPVHRNPPQPFRSYAPIEAADPNAPRRRGSAGVWRKQAMDGLRSPVRSQEGGARRCARPLHCRGSVRSQRHPRHVTTVASQVRHLRSTTSRIPHFHPVSARARRVGPGHPDRQQAGLLQDEGGGGACKRKRRPAGRRLGHCRISGPQPTQTRALRNIRIHGESCPHSCGCQLRLTVRVTRSGCGIRIVARPSSLDRPVMPSGEPFGLSG